MQKIEGPIQDFWLHVGIKPGREKVSFGGIVPGEHYTIIWKEGERKIDIHVTYDDPEREKEKVFEISFYAMNRLLVHLKKMEDLYKIYLSGRTTTLSKLESKNKDLLLHPITGFGDERAQWLEIKERKMKVRKSGRDHAGITFLSPTEASIYRHCHWQVYGADQKWKGFIYQKVMRGETPEFIYVSKSRHDTFRRELRKRLQHAVQSIQYFSKRDLF